MPGVTKRTTLSCGTSPGISGKKYKKKICPFINGETFQP